jgi:hypothetical protein
MEYKDNVDDINDNKDGTIKIYRSVVNFSTHKEAYQFLKDAIKFIVYDDNIDDEPLILNATTFFNKHEMASFLSLLIDKLEKAK